MTNTKIPNDKGMKEEKSREEVEAERKARKAAKAAKKVKPGSEKPGNELKTEANDQPKMIAEKENKLPNGNVPEGLPAEANDKQSKKETVEQAETPEKSKAELRAERRAVQEAQRAAKMQQTEKGQPFKEKQNLKKEISNLKTSIVAPKVNRDSSGQPETTESKPKVERKAKKSVSWVKPSFFGHLPVVKTDISLVKEWSVKNGNRVEDLHPAFLKLGLHYASGLFVGGNARARGLLQAVKKMIADCLPPPGKDISRDFWNKLDKNLDFIELCRPASVSMLNAVRHLRSRCCHLGDQKVKLTNQEFKEKLLEDIDEFNSNITLASLSIASYLHEATANDRDKEIYLTFGCSSTVNNVLTELKVRQGRKFHVVVVNSHVRPEGRTTVRRLTKQEIPCTLVSSEHVSFIMKYVTKVLIGCSALLVNSDVLSRVGTSQVALIAKSQNVPVLACCETYKCATRPQTDAFGVNELGDSNAVIGVEGSTSLSGLNLSYDITPASFITAVVTESGMFPCDAAKAILRLKQLDTDE